MPYKLESLPDELKNELQDGAQQIFVAAFNSAEADGMSEESARSVAWNTIKQAYEKGGDGKWHRKPDATNRTNKSTVSGGN
jgi:cation transport regulator